MHQFKILKNIHRTLSLPPLNKLPSYVEKGFVEEKYLQPTLKNEVNFIIYKKATPMWSMQTNPLEEMVMLQPKEEQQIFMPQMINKDESKSKCVMPLRQTAG